MVHPGERRQDCITICRFIAFLVIPKLGGTHLFLGIDHIIRYDYLLTILFHSF